MPVTVLLSELHQLEGRDLGSTDWLTITQERITTFADATDDHQWIHTEPERAADGPFGKTIAHGYLTLALIIPLFTQLLEVDGVTTKLNYGLDRVRFPAPVPVGSRVRLHATLLAVESLPGDGVQFVWEGTVEIEGSAKPACVARPVFRFYP